MNPGGLLMCLAVGFGAEPQDVPTLSVDDARDMTEEGLAFVELLSERDTYFVHERIRLRLRFGLEDEYRRTSMIQPFRRPLDVPVQVQAPWIADLPGFLTADPAAPGPPSRFALNDQLAVPVRRESEERGERWFTVFEIDWSFLPETPGSLPLPGPALRFAYATRFREDLLNGRVPEDRHDAVVFGPPLVLQIRSLPEEGRPLDFSGAVGRFTVAAAVDPPSVVVGESVELRVRVEGEGCLQFLAPAPLELAGFQVLGVAVEEDAAARVIKYDLAPRSARVTAVPPVSFTFFDPAPPGTYDKVWTKPLALGVRAAPVPGVDDIFGLKPVPAGGGTGLPSRPATSWVLGALVAPWLVVLGIGVQRRARRRDDPARARARAAAAAFRGREPGEGTDSAQDLIDFLAACLDCSSPAVIARDLAERLASGGVPGDLATRTAQHLDALLGARYGGLAPSDAGEATRALVDELEQAFLAAEGTR